MLHVLTLCRSVSDCDFGKLRFHHQLAIVISGLACRMHFDTSLSFLCHLILCFFVYTGFTLFSLFLCILRLLFLCVLTHQYRVRIMYSLFLFIPQPFSFFFICLLLCAFIELQRFDSSAFIGSIDILPLSRDRHHHLEYLFLASRLAVSMSFPLFGQLLSECYLFFSLHINSSNFVLTFMVIGSCNICSS